VMCVWHGIRRYLRKVKSDNLLVGRNTTQSFNVADRGGHAGTSVRTTVTNLAA
jgi:hypothetical protein